MPGRAIMRTIANVSIWFLSLWSPATVAAIGGTVLSVAGLHMVYPPLAYIVPGAGLLALAGWMAAPPSKGKG